MPKAHRLTREDFSSRPPTRRLHGALFSLSASPRASGGAKFACVVSKKVALKAHDRNLLKRRCREAARTYLKHLKAPLALVAQAKKQAVGASFADIREDIKNLIQSCQ